LIFPEAFLSFVQVIAESLSEEEIGGLKELFKMIDTDNSGTITYDELKDGLKRVGSDLMEPEIQALMDAVSATPFQITRRFGFSRYVAFVMHIDIHSLDTL
jgi:Ca2+-binding EF-hand superfamily protein